MISYMKKGLLIILSGPSGVGKGTVRRYILNHYKLPFSFSISMTTRKPRQNEVDGVDYYFVSQAEFQRNIDANNFLEWAEFIGNRYGTPKDKVEELRKQGKNVLLEIEVNGASQVMNNVKDDRVVSFFLMPPSVDDLENRIRSRRSETEEVIRARLAKGVKEMALADNYDYVIYNDSVAEAAKQMVKTIRIHLKK